LTETTELYGGEVILEFNPGNHQYRVIIRGRKYKPLAVTRICSIVDKPALIYWAIDNTLDVVKAAIGSGAEYSETYLTEVYRAARKSSQGIKKLAADEGKEIHQAIEGILRGGESLTGQCPQADGVVEWLRRNGYVVVEVERRVYSRRHRYSGTLDAIAETDEGLWLLDWKTGKHIYAEHRLQTAAYVKAWEEETGRPIKGRIILHTRDEQIRPYVVPVEALKGDWSAFLGAKRLFEQVQKIEKELKKLK
jgi:hypothetical protein